MDWLKTISSSLYEFRKDIFVAVISTIVGAFITWLLERRKERREDRKEQLRNRQSTFENRPEMEIADYEDYISCANHHVKRKYDLECVLLPIKRVLVEGKKKRDAVFAYYKDEHLQPEKWLSVIYTFRNAGKTDISTLHIISNLQKNVCLFSKIDAKHLTEEHLLNYSCCYDQKIRVGNSISVKICYPENAITSGLFSAALSIGMEDDNGRFWTQPLFSPENKVYDSRPISATEYWEKIRTDIAEECFKKPYLW